MLFTRDLRVHDNPALAAAVHNADQIVPMFVLDPRISVGPNRQRFLGESVGDLRESLRASGGDLLVRHGDPVAEVIKVAAEVDATGVAMTRDVSGFAIRRERRVTASARGTG